MITTPRAPRFGFGLLLWFAAAVAAVAQSAPTIFYASESVTVSGGQSAGFRVTTVGNLAHSHQWQRLAVDRVTWADLSDGGSYSGTNTGSLTVAAATGAMNGDRFRCVVANGAGSTISPHRTLTVVPSESIPREKWPVPRFLTPGFSVNRNQRGAAAEQSMVAQTIAQPPVGTKSSSSSVPRVVVKLRNSSAQSLALAISSATGAVQLASVPAIDRNLAALLSKHAVRRAAPLFAGAVRSQRQQGRTDVQVRSAMRQRFPQRASRAPVRATPPDLSSTYVLEVGGRSAQQVAETVRSLRTDVNVIYAEEDRSVQVSYVPNDPSYSRTGTWGQNYQDLYGLKKIGTTEAWDVTHGKGVVVAVIDTGIDYNHPDISGNIWINPGEIAGNGIDDDNNGFIDDVRGWDFVGHDSSQPVADSDPFDGHYHGTHVAGTIAATGNNNLGVVGVAWQAKVMAIKGLDDSGSGYESDLAKAIVYAVDNGADVINASWGGAGFSQTETDAIDYAHANGVVFVAAAGNSNSKANDFTPASVPNAIAVSSLDPYDNLSNFSNFGSKVELAAPGEDILSLEAGTSGYTRHSGTSMAAPHVSGVAALIIALHPTYSNEQVRQALRLSAADLGVLGKDSSFGYGRVDAAQGVLVNQALEARILGLTDGTKISAPLALTGSAGGLGFDHYVVDYGAGESPTAWTTLRNSTTSVASGDIGTLDPSGLPDGIYSVRLRVFSTGGTVFCDYVQIHVHYLEITSPVAPLIPVLTQEVKPGTALQITGTATGPSFRNYHLEWAPGLAATSGWSTVGFTPSDNGLSPVFNGVLGVWTPPVTLKGYYTIRLVVSNTSFSSIASTAVYAEPELLSSAWPLLVGPVLYPPNNVHPMRQPDGSTRLLLVGFPSQNGSQAYSFALDGTLITAPLNFSGERQPCVGNLDGLPGDEAVIADGIALKIFSSELTPVRTITTNPARIFWEDQIILADLDNDGLPEIIAPARDTQSPGGTTYRESGALYVYRADGTIFSSNYPLTITSPLTITGEFGGFYGVMVVAVDLDGDGWKEIVMAVEANDHSGYTLSAFNANGTRYLGWSTRSVSGFTINSMSAADLDHDGTTELVIAEQSSSTNQITVVNSTGAIRAGWPVALDWGVCVAIGDVDRDQIKEIVVASYSSFSVLRGDGTFWSQPKALSGEGNGMNSSPDPIIADIDGDGIPEILIVVTTLKYGDSRRYFEMSLVSFRLDGTVQKSWPLFGMDGQQPTGGVPLVGDFNADGQTDIVVCPSLIAGGDVSGFLINSSLTCLATGTTFNESGSDWASSSHDPQNSRNANKAAPKITTQPSNQTTAAGNVANFTATASGAPIPTFQWKKDGMAIPGATKSSLTLSNALVSDTGSYTLVVTNLNGSTTSHSATLTVTKGTPVITWPVPAPITSGTALSGTQLNATASVAGTFVYSPASGTVLNAGRHTLNGSFTPADLANYFGASHSRSLIVNLASGAPLFLVQPASQSSPIGASVTFMAEASAMTAPTYQWKKNGVNIVGATGSSYTIASVVSGDVGNYTVVATNSAGSAISNVALLAAFVAVPSNAVISFTVE